MKDYIPLQSSWKNHFLESHLQYTLSQIQFHENNLIRICDASSSKLFKQLKPITFDQELKSRVSNQNEINELCDIWQKTRHLLHLNTRQLLDMLQEEVIPLERHYHLAIDALQKKKTETEINGIAKWFNPSLAPYISKVQENQAQLQMIKFMIYDGLLYRALAYRLLNSTSNVDDIGAAICHKINGLNVLSQPLTIKAPYSITLNDDRRLAIFDYLLERHSDKDALYEMILSPVFKKGYPSFKSAAEIKGELEHIRKFHKKIIKDLAKHPDNENYARLEAVIPLGLRKAGSRVWRTLKAGFVNITILFPILAYLSSFRYVFYLSLSFFSYHYLVLMLQPITTFLLGVTLFNIINSLLFYSLAMAPVWILTWNFLVSSKNKMLEFLTQRKKNQLYCALDILTQNQEFIANHLSQVIIDIPNYDIQHTTQQIRQQQENLVNIKQKLNQFIRGEKILCKGVIDATITLVQTKLESQEEQLLAHAALLAKHIALRVGQDIEILHKAIDKQTLAVTIADQQLEKLEQFVKTFGDEAAILMFEQNSNPIYKWANKIERCVQNRAIDESLMQQPWGGWVVRKDYLKGWEIILRGYLPYGIKQNAALQLNKLLSGDSTPSLTELSNWLGELDIGDQKPLLMQKIQTHIFKTLNKSTAQNANLINDQHKDLIAKWYEEHKVSIQEAQNKILFLLNAARNNVNLEMSDLPLSNIYDLLEGGDIYCYSFNKDDSDIKQRKHLASEYFDLYQGQSSKAIRFLSFFPEEEQLPLLIKIAKIRLFWILQHLDNEVNPAKPFDEVDIELFYDYRLVKSFNAFDFTSFILQSSTFNAPWDPKVETFLEACRRNGLDSGKLLLKYQETNCRIKPFILYLHEAEKNLVKPSATSHLAEKKDPCRVKLSNPM